MTADQVVFIAKVELALQDFGAELIKFNQEGLRPSWDINIVSDGVTWQLRICTDGFNIDELPSVYWLKSSIPWGWPHVSSSGDVCVSDREGLEYDPDDVSSVIAWLLNEAIELLSANIAMDETLRLISFSDELEAYLRNDGARFAVLNEQIQSDKVLYAEVTTKRKSKSVFPDAPLVLGINQGNTSFSSCRQEHLGLLTVDINQINGLRKEWKQDWWDSFIETLSSAQQKEVCSVKNRGVVLQIPNSFGHSLILLYWGLNHKKKGYTYVLQRQYHEYLVQRTGGDLDRRHVVVIGCGAVGSRVAEHLVLSGISHITLVDNDIFTADNLGRHVLGKESVSKYKVNELARIFKDRMPGIQIEAKATIAQTLLKENILSTFEAVILATGNSVLERSIVRKAFKERWRSLIVSTSVEACGLGGHAIAMRPGTLGCLDCLYIDPDSQQFMSTMCASLIAPEQKVTRQLTGCGAFTPYSAMDATRTAILAVERVLLNTPGYSRWAGDSLPAKQQGIESSDTHTALREGRISTNLDNSEFFQPRCPCCSI